MRYVVVKDYFANAKFINGGAQCARNLINGLKDIGSSFSIISWSSGESTDATINTGIHDSIPYVSISDLHGPQTWNDNIATEFIHKVVSALPRTPSVFHLFETDFHLGTWIRVLKQLQHKVVITALDYSWLCARSHLLKANGDQCNGPESGHQCVSCYYSHRNPVQSFAQRLSVSLLLPVVAPMSGICPNTIRTRVNSIDTHKKITYGRVRSLADELQAIDALVAPSMPMREKFIEFGIPANRVFHVPYGTIPGRAISFLERPDVNSEFIMGYCGKLTFDKGLDILLDAIVHIRRTTRHRPRLVVFTSPHPSGFGRAIQSRMVSEECREWLEQDQYNGRIGEDIDRAHSKFHLLVTPSRWTDNRPNAALEALARTTPILAPDYGSFKELIEVGDNGWFFKLNDVKSLSEILKSIMESPEKYLNLPFTSNKVRSLASEAQDIVSIYERVSKANDPHQRG